MKRNFRLGTPLAACAMLLASTGFATSIPVNNPSFATRPPGGLPFSCGSPFSSTDCIFSDGPIPGWTESPAAAGLSGQLQPGTQDGNLTYFSSLPDGITTAYASGGTISQTVGATVQAGVTYTPIRR
jgi:hypothetical protein